MVSPFPPAKRGSPGYDPDHVGKFLDQARRAFEESEDGLNSRDIRHKVFPLVAKEGFDTKAVDEALWRLEEAFAEKERASEAQKLGEETFYSEVRLRAQEILDRVARPNNFKFRTVSKIRPGYRPSDVDSLCDRIGAYLQQQEKLAVTELRAVLFRTALGGYDEKQVDLLIDETVSIMLSVR